MLSPMPPQGALAPSVERDVLSDNALPPKATMVDRPKRTKITRRPVHGVLLLDKPLGWSSNDALQKVKWLLRAEKAGHTGTLDPLATGVLPLCFGAATKFSQLQLDAPKTYEAVASLGVVTTTGDAEGDVVRRCDVDIASFTEDRLEELTKRFTGLIEQVPPMHSALKKDGKALYEYARAGVEVERVARSVTIHALKMALSLDSKGLPAIKIVVTCSKGTYIRTLGEDIGAALGCGAHLSFLRRIDTGGLGIDRCVTLEQLEAMHEDERLACVQPPELLLSGHVPVTLGYEDAARFLSGVRRRGDWPHADAVAVFGDVPRALLGVGHIVGGELVPDRLLSPLEIQQILEGTPPQQASGILEKL
jgi:tRNA pseudouridine55 synthase